MNDVPRGYKQTEVGVIPEDWEATKIGECLKVRHGKSQCDVFSENGEYPILGTGGEIGRALQPLYSKPSVLIGRKGTIDVPRYMDTPFWSVDTLFYSEVNENVNAKFMFYQFCMVDWYQHNEASGVPSLNANTIEKILRPLPPTKAEQEAIAEALGDADALIESLEQLIAKKRQIKQGAMQELLTGKKRLPGFAPTVAHRTVGARRAVPLRNAEHHDIPDGWEAKRLGDVAESLDNLRIPLNEAQRNQMKGDYPYCGANGVLDYVNDYVIDDDIILMAEDGGYFDEFAYRPIAYRMVGKCWVNNHAHILKAKAEYDQEFLFYSLVNKNILDYLASGTRAKLNKSEMNKIEVSLPLAKEEQTAIATILSDMDTELTTLETKLAKARHLKQGMMQELLTGRIRLL